MAGIEELEDAYEKRYLSPLPWWFRATYKALEEATYQKQGAAIPLLRRGSSRDSLTPVASWEALHVKMAADAVLARLARLIKEG